MCVCGTVGWSVRRRRSIRGVGYDLDRHVGYIGY